MVTQLVYIALDKTAEWLGFTYVWLPLVSFGKSCRGCSCVVCLALRSCISQSRCICTKQMHDL